MCFILVGTGRTLGRAVLLTYTGGQTGALEKLMDNYVGVIMRHWFSVFLF